MQANQISWTLFDGLNQSPKAQLLSFWPKQRAVSCVQSGLGILRGTQLCALW
jgi:hypothetical protein